MCYFFLTFARPESDPDPEDGNETGPDPQHCFLDIHYEYWIASGSKLTLLELGFLHLKHRVDLPAEPKNSKPMQMRTLYKLVTSLFSLNLVNESS